MKKNSMPVYFITVIEKIEEIKGDFPKFGDRRTWGFFYDKNDAIEALHKNATDMCETIYGYAVIEESYEGICPNCINRQFFKWNHDNQGYFEINEPECVKRIYNFAIG